MTVDESEAIVGNFSRVHREDMTRAERDVAWEKEKWAMTMAGHGRVLQHNVNTLRAYIDMMDLPGSRVPQFIVNMLRLEARLIEDRANELQQPEMEILRCD